MSRYQRTNNRTAILLAMFASVSLTLLFLLSFLLVAAHHKIGLHKPAYKAATQEVSACLIPQTPPFAQERLQKYFTDDNKEFFHGKLPKTIVEWKNMRADSDIGQTHYDEGLKVFVIDLDPSYNQANDTAKETILHESCHVKTSYLWNTDDPQDPHGPAFQSCLHTLYLQGAFDGLL